MMLPHWLLISLGHLAARYYGHWEYQFFLCEIVGISDSSVGFPLPLSQTALKRNLFSQY
jgi:hypothetical protein